VGEARTNTLGRHRNDLQGLRAVAVLLVALSHAGVSVLKGGYVGVDVFFVLSGFLITGLLLLGAVDKRRVDLRDFYLRRARRILPAAALTLVVTDIVAYRLLNVVRAREAITDSVAAAFFGANIRFAHQGTDYFAQGQPPSPIQHYWSLAVEEQFYLVWPALLGLVLFGVALTRHSRRRRAHGHRPRVREAAIRRLLLAVIVVAVGSLAWSVYETHHQPVAAYFSSFARAWELALGALLAVAGASLARVPALVRRLLGWAGLAGIAASATLFSSSTAFPGYAALLPTVGAALVIAAGLASDGSRLAPGRVLSIAPLRYVGDRSYAFYLWHWPVLVIAADYEGHELGLKVKLLLLVGAFALSMFSYAFVENPLRRIKSQSASALFWPVSLAAVVFVAVFAINAIDRKNSQAEMAAVAPELSRAGNPTAAANLARIQLKQAAATASAAESGTVLPAVVAAVKAADRGEHLPSVLAPPAPELINDYYRYPSGCVANALDKTSTSLCRLGNASAHKTLVVFGDSHAQMWMPAILAMAAHDDWAVIPLVKSGCTPSTWVSNKGRSACHTWYRWAVGQAVKLGPDVTLIGGVFDRTTPAAAQRTTDGLSDLTSSMSRHSKHVVLIGDPPGEAQEPVDCLLARHATMQSCASAPGRAYLPFYEQVASIADTGGVEFLDTTGWFCSNDLCPMVIGGTIAYRDEHHISSTYATALAVPFRIAFQHAIQPARPVKPAGAKRPKTKRATAASDRALAMVEASVHAAERGAPLPAALTPAVANLIGDHYDYPAGCQAFGGHTTSKLCRLGDTAAKRSIVVIGDSHSQMWMPAILSLAVKDHWVVIPFEKPGCTPPEWTAAGGNHECRSWYQWAVREAKTLHPDVTMVAGDFARTSSDDDAFTGIESTATAMKPFSGVVIVIGDPPGQPEQPVDCLLRHHATMATCSSTPSANQQNLYDDVAATAKRHGVRFLDTQGWFCARNLCPTVIGRTVAYSDKNHVTKTYALTLSQSFRASFRAAVRV
jgi:peptidoglycan/LPS O-acetylase OafA/YrhL